MCSERITGKNHSNFGVTPTHSSPMKIGPPLNGRVWTSMMFRTEHILEFGQWRGHTSPDFRRKLCRKLCRTHRDPRWHATDPTMLKTHPQSRLPGLPEMFRTEHIECPNFRDVPYGTSSTSDSPVSRTGVSIRGVGRSVNRQSRHSSELSCEHLTSDALLMPVLPPHGPQFIRS